MLFSHISEGQLPRKCRTDDCGRPLGFHSLSSSSSDIVDDYKQRNDLAMRLYESVDN